MKNETAIFGGGCFWCTEAIFQNLKGVISVVPGYAGGNIENPTYEQVSSGQTGHAEVIKIEYDPSLISFTDLLSIFFNTHDPTTLNQQGADIGTQYRSVIFYTNDSQREEAEGLIRFYDRGVGFTDGHGNPRKIVTEVLPARLAPARQDVVSGGSESVAGGPLNFYEAEDYHKKYFETHPEAAYCNLVIAPKLEDLNKKFAELVK